MKAQIKKHGAIIEVVAEGDQKDLIEKMAFWQSLPDTCGNCGHDKLDFFSKRPQNYHYTGLKCQSCGWEMPFGVRQSDEMLYLKEWEAPYQGSGGGGSENTGNTHSQQSHSNAAPEMDDDDIPF